MFLQKYLLPTFEIASLFSAITPGKELVASPYRTLAINAAPNVTRVTFNSPPINLLDAAAISELHSFLTSLDPSNRTTPPPKIVVFDSANPGFFLGHLDLNVLVEPITPTKLDTILQYSDVGRLFQNLTSTIFIAEINGHAIGGGHELTLQMDMRLAGPKAYSASIEDSLGLDVGGGGQLYLGSLIGKGRALEYLTAAKAFDGPTGATLGLFNHYYNSADALRYASKELAGRIALLPAGGLTATKASLGTLLNPSAKMIEDDANAFFELVSTPEAQALLHKVLAASENQTNVAFELGAPDTYVDLSRS